jgi:hypothetical protein
MGAVGGGHVGKIGGELPTAPAAAMRGDPASFEEHLDGGGGESDFEALVHEWVRDAVVVEVHHDVVVDVHRGVAPFAHLVARGGERP